MSNQAVNTFEDLTGVSTSSFGNPYDALIAACEDDPVRCFCILYSHLLSTFLQTRIQEKYELHRTTRNQQQKAKMLDANFQGVNIDPILLRVHDTTVEPGYKDPRNCFVRTPMYELDMRRKLTLYTNRSFGEDRHSKSRI